MYEIFFNWCGDMSKNTVKNGKQKKRVRGSKLGIICRPGIKFQANTRVDLKFFWGGVE